jgi:hypothetical protein
VNALCRRWTAFLISLTLLCPFSFGSPFNPNISSQVDAFLTSRSSPIAGNGSVFLSDALLYNVDPRLIVAIAGAESSFGTRWVNCPASGFNAWSWFYNGNCPNSPFSSFASGIDTVTKFMRRSYLNKGRTTIALIGQRYCASGCQNWAPNVTTYYSQLGGDTSDLAFISIVGQWTGTATLTDETGTQTLQVSASFSISGNTLSGTVAVTEPGDVADINTITYQAITPNSFSLNNNANPVVTTASGTVTVSPGQAVIAGNGSDNDPTDQSTGVGSLTLIHGLMMSGKVTVTEPDGQTTGNGIITISPDGKTLSGNAQVSDGSSVNWTVRR